MNQNKIFLLSTLLATSPMAQSSDMPIREKRATEEQQSKYRTMTGLENFAGKYPNDAGLYCLLHRKKMSAGLILTGEHGVGKTLLITELAKKANIPLVTFDISHCCGQGDEWFFSKALDNVFHKAKKIALDKDTQVIILLDNLDSINSFSYPIHAGLSWGLLLSALDKVERNKNIMILATAKKYECIRGEIADRIGSELVMPLPEDQGRQDIFKFYVSKYPTQEELNISKMIKASKGFTGADIERAVKEASMAAQMHDDKKISQEDLWEVFQSIKEEVGHRERSTELPKQFLEKHAKVILAVVLAATIIVAVLLANKKFKNKKKIPLLTINF